MWVAVSGPSMVPTLRHGDTVAGAARRARSAAGDVVVARFRALPGRLVRQARGAPHDGGWWLASDNTFAGGDSAAHGVADVVGAGGRCGLRPRPAAGGCARRAAGVTDSSLTGEPRISRLLDRRPGQVR